MRTRQATDKDIPSIMNLFMETVRKINGKDYNEDEIEVWASAGNNAERWKSQIKEQYFIVGEFENKIVGFSSIKPNGYLDYLYVHKDYQGKGIANKLFAEIEYKARLQKNAEIFTFASKTAKSFFEKLGFIHTKDETHSYKGVNFVNSEMKKKL